MLFRCNHLMNEPHYIAPEVAQQISTEAMNLLKPVSNFSTTKNPTGINATTINPAGTNVTTINPTETNATKNPTGTNATATSKNSGSKSSSFTINNLIIKQTGSNCGPVIHSFVGGFNCNQPTANVSNAQEPHKSDEVHKDPPNTFTAQCTAAATTTTTAALTTVPSFLLGIPATITAASTTATTEFSFPTSSTTTRTIGFVAPRTSTASTCTPTLSSMPTLTTAATTTSVPTISTGNLYTTETLGSTSIIHKPTESSDPMDQLLSQLNDLVEYSM
ncbi:unnamed protein product [Rotaria sordida]|uniref:Uncharacterized protein n=1 Tax=Rotaria sordida TaxID=392033 RepID=A0A814P3A4_9BILA|nr:unnamed protein product [Rotaria sordida]CAF4147317.1 unnamed protein product [Rotaria sordida]